MSKRHKPAAGTPSKPRNQAIKIVTENRKARFDFSIIETMEAGLVLVGSEVKSLRKGQVQLKDSYVVFKNGEAWLQKAHISPYLQSSYMNHEPERYRKLLLNHAELSKLERAIEEKGLTCVPLKLYFKGGIAKLEIAIARGKNAGDKRETTKKKDVQRQLDTARRR